MSQILTSNRTNGTKLFGFWTDGSVCALKDQIERFSSDFGHKLFGFRTIKPKIVRFEPKSPKTERSVFGHIYWKF